MPVVWGARSRLGAMPKKVCGCQFGICLNVCRIKRSLTVELKPSQSRVTKASKAAASGCVSGAAESAGHRRPAWRDRQASTGLERSWRACENRRHTRGSTLTLKARKTLSEGQRAYEAKRAAKAGMSLEKWLASKQRQQEAEARARDKAADPPKPAKKPGLLARLLERAQRPL
jgi:hypothetical protein